MGGKYLGLLGVEVPVVLEVARRRCRERVPRGARGRVLRGVGRTSSLKFLGCALGFASFASVRFVIDPATFFSRYNLTELQVLPIGLVVLSLQTCES